MSDIMRPIPFSNLMNWILSEYKSQGSIFGVSKLVRHDNGKALPMFKEKIESPYGPAAGPHTQLAQNLVAAYAAGSRFFELKTVQIMDGDELSKCVAKPCITADDECYNCEWSTELYVPRPLTSTLYVYLLLAKELGLGNPDGFVFNMSVGYDLKGIQSEKIDKYIEGMKDASGSAVWKECMDWALNNLDKFQNVDADYVKGISPKVSNSITESTLHGCPPDEIERIATYLITEKNLNTYVKCNPTLLGYEFARKTLDGLGFDYIAFDDHHFVEDLQWADAVPMFQRLMKLTARAGSGVRREADQHLPRGREGRRAAQRGDVHVRPLPVPPVPVPGGQAGQGIRRQAAHLLLRRRRLLQHQGPVQRGHLAHHHGHHRPQVRRLPAVQPDRQPADGH